MIRTSWAFVVVVQICPEQHDLRVRGPEWRCACLSREALSDRAMNNLQHFRPPSELGGQAARQIS